MDKQIVFNTDEKTEEISDEQKILENAESIILSTTKELKHSTNKKCFLFVVLPILILMLLILMLSTIFALINTNNTKILNGVSIQGIDVSNLSVDEARIKVSTAIDEHLAKEIYVTHNDFEASILPEQFGVSFDVDSAVNEAYDLGRSANIFENNFTILNVLLKGSNILPSISYDEDMLNSIISGINEQLPDRVINFDYYIDGSSLIITSGNDGVLIDGPEFKQQILLLLNNINKNSLVIDIPVSNVKANSIDIETIYAAVHKEPVDAYYTTNPYVVYPSSNGLDFDISLDEARAMLETYQEEYIIPLKTTYPNVSTNQIGNEAFPDLLSEFSTSFTTSNSNRSTNIILAASKISGTVLMPGETFSYNQVVGQRTKEAGFKEAPAYLNGKVVQEYGGGICQVSSTLYNAVLYANLEITERTNHGFKPSYVPPGLDATVSWGGPDFKFTNNRNYPIRIICDTSGKILNIYIYGLKTDDDFTVKLDAQYVSTVYAKTVYQTDSSLASGQSKVIQDGSNGCKTVTYKYLYDKDGNLVSSECISRDTYNPHNKIVAVGP